MFKQSFKKFRRKGQTLVLYAFMVPLLFTVGAAAVDWGWYYTNVVRLQNAADAAAIAGAYALIGDESSLSDYTTVSDALIPVPDYLIRGDVKSKRDRTRGDTAAKNSVKSNIGEDKDFNFSSTLWGSDAADYRTLYYEVTLEENVKHLFLGDLDPMPTKATAVAKITHYMEGPNLFDQTLAIAEAQTYKTWDKIKFAKKDPDALTTNGDNDKNGTNKANSRSILSTGNRHKDGDYYRTETLHITGRGGINVNDKNNNTPQGNPYKTKGKIDQSGYDDLFIDWQGDMSKMIKEDLDLNVNNAASNLSTWSRKLEDNKDITTVDTYKYALKYRIHGNINVDKDENGKFPYPVRNADFFKDNTKALENLNDTYIAGEGTPLFNKIEELTDADYERIAKEPPDPLYLRIESEPVHDGKGLNPDGSPIVGEKASSVHQIIINLNVSNATETYPSGEFKGEYSDRPIFFYYTGPEKVKENSHVRDSLPVIINFNADFRGIFFFPNSPVVINGNNKNFQGYVIAKEYVMLKDRKEYLYDYENNVYYDKSLPVINSTTGMLKIKDSPIYQQVTINGTSKYVLKSDLEKFDLSQYETPPDSEFTSINNFWYNVDNTKTAEDWAYATGNGKVKYYYTLEIDKNEGWTYYGEGYFDRDNNKDFKNFLSGWHYNNQGKIGDQGVWRVKEILRDGTEGAWLDETDEYKNKFLLKYTNEFIPRYFYLTADEFFQTVMNKNKNYIKIEGTDYWRTKDALSYVQIETEENEENYYYVPSTVSIPKTYDGDDAVDVVRVKYYEDGTEKEAYLDVSSNPEKYYLIHPRDDNGNDTTLNPMMIDSLG